MKKNNILSFFSNSSLFNFELSSDNRKPESPKLGVMILCCPGEKIEGRKLPKYHWDQRLIWKLEQLEAGTILGFIRKEDQSMKHEFYHKDQNGDSSKDKKMNLSWGVFKNEALLNIALSGGGKYVKIGLNLGSRECLRVFLERAIPRYTEKVFGDREAEPEEYEVQGE